MEQEKPQPETGKRRRKPRPVAEGAIGIPLEQTPAFTGLSRTTVFQLAKVGKLERIKVGRSSIITLRSIRALLHGEAA